MEEHVRQALEIVKAQAGFRIMAEEEISSMVRALSIAISRMAGYAENGEAGQHPDRLVADRTPRDNAIICLECQNAYKMLTRKHLASHGLTPVEYREKWGYAKSAPLVCKALQRLRRKKMKDMRLWEKRQRPEE